MYRPTPGAECVLLLGGPTCSGKSALALDLAERCDAEIVGADSRQIYRGMPIGTAAPTPQDRARVRHHLVEFLAPQQRYSAARYAADALRAIESIHARGKRVIVAGGTGFYLRALAGDVALSPAYDEALRERIARETRTHPPDVLHAWLQARDPKRAAAVAPTDRYRVARALEIALARDGAVRDDRADGAALRRAGVAFVKVALDVDATTLDERIAARLDSMLARGLVDEAQCVGRDAVAADAIGYPQALAYLAGWSSRCELRQTLFRTTRRYAKRQATWFRNDPGFLHVQPCRDIHNTIVAALGW